MKIKKKTTLDDRWYFPDIITTTSLNFMYCKSIITIYEFSNWTAHAILKSLEFSERVVRRKRNVTVLT